MAERGSRRTFGPVVLLGLAGAGLSALAGHERWVSGTSCGQAAAASLNDATGDVGQAPAAGAVALLLLAAWGVLLVTRGWVRRGVAGLVVLAALGLVAAVVFGPRSARGTVQDHFSDFGISCTNTGLTGWYWVAVVGALLALVPALLAVRLVPTWPEMGRRYDAPTGGAAPTPEEKPLEERENLDLWKAINEGHDPTA